MGASVVLGCLQITVAVLAATSLQAGWAIRSGSIDVAFAFAVCGLIAAVLVLHSAVTGRTRLLAVALGVVSGLAAVLVAAPLMAAAAVGAIVGPDWAWALGVAGALALIAAGIISSGPTSNPARRVVVSAAAFAGIGVLAAAATLFGGKVHVDGAGSSLSWVTFVGLGPLAAVIFGAAGALGSGLALRGSRPSNNGIERTPSALD